MQKPRWETPDPKGVRGSYGPEVAAWASRELGIQLDDWQLYILGKALRHDRHGDLIHRRALWSTGRQNGKSVICRSLFGWLLDPEAGGRFARERGWEEITAAAHDAKQARIIYKGVYRDLRRIKRLTYRPRERGEKGERPPVYLTLQTGIQAEHLTFDISTAAADSARGHTYGVVAWDEVLTQKDQTFYEAMGPTQIAQRSPIMLLTSTAGFADSVVLRDFYDRLVRQSTGAEDPDPTFYGAWWQSEDPDAGLDWKAIKQANPSPRLTKAALSAEHRSMTPDGWKRERLNHWIDLRVEGAVNPQLWAKVREFDGESPLAGLRGPYALGVREHPGWERATICVAGTRSDGRIGVEVYRDIRGTDAVPVTAARIIGEVDAFPSPVQKIAFDASSGAAAEFRRHAEETGQEWDELRPGMIVDACMDVTEMIQAGRLAVRDPLIDAQIAHAGRRNVGQDGAFRWSIKESLGPIDAVYAMTFAAHAIAYRESAPSLYVPTRIAS